MITYQLTESDKKMVKEVASMEYAERFKILARWTRLLWSDREIKPEVEAVFRKLAEIASKPYLKEDCYTNNQLYNQAKHSAWIRGVQKITRLRI